MIPPGIPEFPSRIRHLAAGRHLLRGRAWSGRGRVAAVEVSVDSGVRWRPARVDPPASATSWSAWEFGWTAEPGEYELCCRATDAGGGAQPLAPEWNARGLANNAVQRIRVRVR
jgi:hypothetical protein